MLSRAFGGSIDLTKFIKVSERSSISFFFSPKRSLHSRFYHKCAVIPLNPDPHFQHNKVDIIECYSSEKGSRHGRGQAKVEVPTKVAAVVGKVEAAIELTFPRHSKTELLKTALKSLT